MRPSAIVIAALLALGGCAETTPDKPPPPLTCDAGLEMFRGACVEPARRYEPAEAVDHDNVVAYGDPITVLKLPPPPKSGFRIIAPPRKMAAGEEQEFCLSWPFPTFKNRVIYAARLYTTPGLHHSNLITKAVDPMLGKNPYPSCNPGAGDPFSQIPDVIPDVLFANSTQVVGEETLVFPEGMGYRVDPTREISTDIHLLNTGTAAQVVEVAYDFTMSEDDLKTLVAPFVLQVNDFLIPPHSIGKVGSTCSVYGGKVVTLMPHTHKLSQEFTVDFLKAEGGEERVLDDGPFDAQSHIQGFDPQLDLSGVSQIKYECTFNNTTNHDVVYGLGENEMCVLFGYLYPPHSQFVAYSDYQGKPCNSIQIGAFH